MSETVISDSAGAPLPEPEGFAAARGYAAQRWTAEKPTAAGWWWVETPIDRRIVRVWESNSRGLVASYYGVGIADPISHAYFKRWAGPMPEPLEAPTEETPHTM